jgi:sulfate adenylyltransferase subunit 1 (EFTu-like GTPase family)
VVTSSIKANVFWLSTRPFSASDELVMRVATQQLPAQISVGRKIDSSTLEPILDNRSHILETEVAEVTIDTRQPLVVEDFNFIQEMGRFVLVRGLDVVAGGVITCARTN